MWWLFWLPWSIRRRKLPNSGINRYKTLILFISLCILLNIVYIFSYNTSYISIDCRWSEIIWSSCSVSCQTDYDKGIRTGTRFVVQEAQNGGLECRGSNVLQESCQNLPRCGMLNPSVLGFKCWLSWLINS